MSIAHKEIKQTPEENVISTYNYIQEDYAEGLDYVIDAAVYNNAMKVYKKVTRVTDSVTMEKYLTDVYSLFE